MTFAWLNFSTIQFFPRFYFVFLFQMMSITNSIELQYTELKCNWVNGENVSFLTHKRELRSHSTLYLHCDFTIWTQQQDFDCKKKNSSFFTGRYTRANVLSLMKCKYLYLDLIRSLDAFDITFVSKSIDLFHKWNRIIGMLSSCQRE